MLPELFVLAVNVNPILFHVVKGIRGAISTEERADVLVVPAGVAVLPKDWQMSHDGIRAG